MHNLVHMEPLLAKVEKYLSKKHISTMEKNDLEMKLAVQQEMLAYLSGGKFPVEFNGKTYEYTNVTGIVDLLKKLQASLLKDTGGANA